MDDMPTLPALQTRGGDETVSESAHGKMVPYAGEAVDTTQKQSLFADLLRLEPGTDVNALRQTVIAAKKAYADACNTEADLIKEELSAFA